MEDEDVEGRVTVVRTSNEAEEDSCSEETTRREEFKRKLSESGDSCTESKKSDYEVGIKENKGEDKCGVEISEESSLTSVDTNAATKVTFKGFKKRILSQTRENHILSSRSNNPRSLGKKAREKRATSTPGEAKRGKITEYAQYLGLQPASNKGNCTSCQTTNSCDPSMLNQHHQCTCPSGIMTQSTGHSSPGNLDSSSTGTSNSAASAPSSANNFRITRKVYLCAACGTYFENWNLFLHMREIHKRHICLFCLGMFGQAERLSYHLMKKHNVPETTFTSVEDFYNVFKGSCYLICCTCEKVFAETDNFYNHFCSPVQKGRSVVGATSEICSLCRQSVNSHSQACSHNNETPVDCSPTNAALPGLPGIPGTPGEPITSPRGTNKRMLKNNRLKRNELSPLTSYRQKMTGICPRKMDAKSREKLVDFAEKEDVENVVKDSTSMTTTTTTTITTTATTTTTTTVGSLETATTTTTVASLPNDTEIDNSDSLRDTVSETIMEVSKCTDESRLREGMHEASADVIEVNSSAVKIVSSPSPSLSSSSVASPLRQQIDTPACYDSVTETIMEVSRCYNEDEPETSENEDDNARTVNESSSRDSDPDALVMDEIAFTDNDDEDDSLNAIKERYDQERLKNLLASGPKNERRRKRRKREEKKESLRLADSEMLSGSSDGEREIRRGDVSNSAVHETERHLSESGSSPEKESQTSVSFTTVNSTDRGLVIKICTNRNAQFSVTRSGANGNYENHDTSRESEENNNAEDSASEGKVSNRSERAERDSCREEDDDDDDDEEEEEEEQSDSNSTRLLVDDTKEVEENEGERPPPPNENFSILNESNEDIRVDDSKTTTSETELGENEKKAAEKAEETTESDKKDEIEKNPSAEESDGIIIASDDIPSIDLNVDGILESMKIEDLLKRCISAASGFCVYCNHARHIAVNGKQLGLHVLAEHRFQPQHPAIIIQREQFTVAVKKSLNEVETKYFNLDSFDSESGTYHVAMPRVFECFHCRYHSLVHKEIYLHNRKMHQKTILICIMCKSTFYSYSELLCHLCPGVYSPNINVTYRCCLCPVSNLPSAFRLMVHLRKRHHSCDVCLESTGNQQRLSNHVWKHKLHHLCYRCGIAYRNKPDITKHLFWKHGTESVLCKKCLQKKWPHVYHFCIPPSAFVCEECTSSFTRAVALKVHKRLHSGDRPYGCSECDERFISKKLALKHEKKHREPEPVEPEIIASEEQPGSENISVERSATDNPISHQETSAATTTTITSATTTTTTTTTTASASTTQAETTTSSLTIVTGTRQNLGENESVGNSASEAKESKEPVKKVVDVYDLPPLNLSSDSDSDDEETRSADPAKDSNSTTEGKDVGKTEDSREISEKPGSPVDQVDSVIDVELNEEAKIQEAQIMDGIWDNFKSYAASLGQCDTALDIIAEEKKKIELDREYLCKIILADHDYCVVYTEKDFSDEGKDEEAPKLEENAVEGGEREFGYKVTKSPSAGSVVLNDSDTNTSPSKRKKEKTPKKKNGTSSSDSSSDSDSSSCSCGTNCSCSSSSSGSSSSSSSSSDSDSSASEGSPRKANARKDRRRDKDKETTAAPEVPNDSTKTELDPEKMEIGGPEEREDSSKQPTATLEQTSEANVEINDRPASPQLVFRESDLDTDETETDEDFYDEHPQQLANKLLAEKRNQLMLLAAVAPPSVEATIPNNLNNGTLESLDNSNSMEIAPGNVGDTNLEIVQAVQKPPATTKKRVKTKKRKKSDRGRASKEAAKMPGTGTPVTPTVESIKLNIPKSFYDKKTKKFGSKAAPMITVVPSRAPTPSMTNSLQHSSETVNEASKIVGGSGSENEAKRSKRKRVPKRFYGDSSDDEPAQQQQQHQLQHHQSQPTIDHHHQQQHYNHPGMKWRKVEQATTLSSASVKAPIPQQTSFAPPGNVGYATKNVTLRLPGFDRPMERIVPMLTGPSESEEQPESSEDSSEESTNVDEQRIVPNRQPVALGVPNTSHPINSTGAPGERSVNLYCYCQCPYDEVSEMIACDGSNCRIEWFHFECVGIMVPPKGKWYCPDCRRKDPTLVNDDCLE